MISHMRKICKYHVMELCIHNTMYGLPKANVWSLFLILIEPVLNATCVKRPACHKITPLHIYPHYNFNTIVPICTYPYVLNVNNVLWCLYIELYVFEHD